MRRYLRMVGFVMTTASENLPVRNPGNGDKVATNLWLRRKMKGPAAKTARDRYDLSLSELVEALLDREVNTKGGLLHAALVPRSKR